MTDNQILTFSPLPTSYFLLSTVYLSIFPM